jgi:hypothetical protein
MCIGYLFARDIKLKRSTVNSVFVCYRCSKSLIVSTIKVAIVAHSFAEDALDVLD